MPMPGHDWGWPALPAAAPQRSRHPAAPCRMPDQRAPAVKYVTTIATMMTMITPRMPQPFLAGGGGTYGKICSGDVLPIAAETSNGL